ncbi:MAG: hypothetical protein PSV24_10290 [Rhodoferax sp.]|nr:hypothetical protein [Rhodoferax sp.]
MPDENPKIEFPTLIWQEEPVIPAKPMFNAPPTLAQNLDIVRTHHPRIGSTLDAIWGYSECEDYLRKLVNEAGDPAGKSREGFSPDVFQAILTLAEHHKITKN